jgi:phosphopantothenoylcysteine decarboxylase/phosphopantothenate--cysteine ligase
MRVVLALSGSISAYKAPLIVRQLIKAGAEVRVVATASALEFVSALTLQNLSGHPVISDLFDRTSQRDGSWHIELAHWCQHLLWAPCSATSLARLATGLCDDAPSLVVISLPRETPITVAPAMDSTMWMHPAVQRNVAQLRADGVHIIEPEVGPLASGLFGPGRLPEPEDLVRQLGLVESAAYRGVCSGPSSAIGLDSLRPDWLVHSADANDLASGGGVNPNEKPGCVRSSGPQRGSRALGVSGAQPTVLLTAGPTLEKLDEVRFISNRSSGKMGYALAQQAQKMGARVILVSGPVALDCPPGVERIWVESAAEMLSAVQQHFPTSDICICAAAVADYRPKASVDGKLKKEEMGPNPHIQLELNPDILAWCGQHKRPGQTVVGFALEANNHLENGWSKLRRKQCDLVVLNHVHQTEGGMGADQNQVTILSELGGEVPLPTLPKLQCAQEILSAIVAHHNASQALANQGGDAPSHKPNLVRNIPRGKRKP